MGKTVLLMLVLVALVAAPVSAQISGDAFPPGTALPRDDDSLYRGAYEVTEEGALIYGGDVEYRCEDLVGFGAPAKPDQGDATAGGSVLEPLTREAVELCAKAGFPPKGATMGASATASAAGDHGTETLPGTGGPPFVAALLLGAVALASAVPVLALRVRQRA